MFRRKGDKIEFFVGHPGGPFWVDKDYWTFLKGEIDFAKDKTALDAARREFKEETGVLLSKDLPYIFLGNVNQNPGKNVTAFAVEYPEIDEAKCKSNPCKVVVCGEEIEVPEIDRYTWMDYVEVKRKTHPSHLVFYEKILELFKKR